MISFLTSTPGAASVRTTPSSVRVNTARSVINTTSCPCFNACSPLNVISEHSGTIFSNFPSCLICIFPSPTSVFSPPARRVPHSTTFLEPAQMFTNPPVPMIFPLNLCTFTFPFASSSAKLKNATSSPPPS